MTFVPNAKNIAIIPMITSVDEEIIISWPLLGSAPNALDDRDETRRCYRML